jgi:hypothetical protein
VAAVGSLGWPPAAELPDALAELLELPPLAVSEDEADDAGEEALLPVLPVLLPAADGVDLLEEQPAASRAAVARVAPVRTSDVRRDITEDHAPGEYSRHLRT